MRIAIFSDNFYPELSGISDSLISLAKQLAVRGHSVDFFAPRYTEKDFAMTHVPFTEIDLGPNIRVHRLFSFRAKTDTGQGRLVIPTGLYTNAVRACNPDVLHTNQFFGVAIEALVASRRLKKPLVGTNHTAVKEFLHLAPVRSDYTDERILRYVNWYYEKCEIVTAPSQSVFNDMIQYGFKQPHMRVVSNPLNVEAFQPATPAEKQSLKKKFGFNDSTMIAAGRFSADRHPDILIKALAIAKKTVPDARLAFGGRGTAEAGMRALAKQLGIEDSVLFLGYLDKKTLCEAYNAAEMYVIASTSDTQNLNMMQAMATGIPVIGVNARGLPEYINENNGFVVEPNDEVAMAEKMIYLLQHPGIAKRLGIDGHEYVQQFSEPAIAAVWEGIYESAIKDYNKKHEN